MRGPRHERAPRPQVRRDRRRRRRLRHARVAAARRGRPVGRGAVEGVPDALAHGRRAGRHRRRARQHVRGQLALAHVRHDQGLRLARRPGRDRVHVPDGAAGRLRARALRHAVRPQRRRHDLPAAVRRPHRRTSARSRCSAPAPPPTAPATRCCTRSTSATSARARSSSSSGWRSTSSATPTATCSASSRWRWRRARS